MTFIQRLGIAVVIAAVIPLFAIHYAYPLAYETHLLFLCTFVWLFMIPLSLYSSPKAPVLRDARSNPVPANLRAARTRALIGRGIVIASAAVFVPYFFLASYSFAERYEALLMGPVLAVFPFGTYLYLTPLCPYCRKLNRANLRLCENCANTLLPNFLQKKNRE